MTIPVRGGSAPPVLPPQPFPAYRVPDGHRLPHRAAHQFFPLHPLANSAKTARPFPHIWLGEAATGAEACFAPLEREKISPMPDTLHQPVPSAAPLVDYFVERDGVKCAGIHLLLELWDAERLDDRAHIEAALRRAVDAAQATLLHIHLHQFSSSGGLSGVAVLAESHISIHTWPERDYAAIDIFMCGECDPYLAVPALREALRPSTLHVNEVKRGVLP